MKRILIAALIVGLPGAATAADLSMGAEPMATPVHSDDFNWTGIYIGGQIGYGWGRGDMDASPYGGGRSDINIEGLVGGGHLGYNHQIGDFVLGIEGDFDGSDIGGNDPCPNPASSCFVDVDWLASVRGRLGYVFDRS